MSRAAAALVGACLLLHQAEVHAAEPAAGTFKIGLLLPPDPAEAQSLRSGVDWGLQLCRDSGNAVELVARGRSGQWGVDGEEAAQLALSDDARGLISPPSGASTHLVLQIAGRTAIPVVSLCGDSSVSGAGIPWMRQVVPETRLEAETLLRHVSTGVTRHGTNWLAIVPAGRQGREILHDLREGASRAGCRIQLGVELRDDGTMAEFRDPGLGSTNPAPRTPTANSLRPQPAATGAFIEILQASKPDGVLIWVADARTAGILEAIVASGYGGVLGGTGRLLNPSFRTNAAAHASKLFIAVPNALANPRNTESARSGSPSVTKHPGSLEVDWLESMACDAVITMVDLCKRADASGVRAADAAEALIGVTGPLRYSADGRRLMDLTVIRADFLRRGVNGVRSPER